MLENTRPAYRGCQQTIAPAAVRVCSIGSERPRPERVIAVVGDSHATHWLAAFDQLGRERNWRVLTYVKASCPVTTARRVLSEEQQTKAHGAASTWGADVRRQIAGNEKISYVFSSTYSSAYDFADDPGSPPRRSQHRWLSGHVEDVGLQRQGGLRHQGRASDAGRRRAQLPRDQPDDRLACSTSAYLSERVDELVGAGG